MTVDIRWPFGEDKLTGAIVHVSVVPSGRECGVRCPNCGVGFIAKKGRVREHHFAHAVAPTTCTGEGVVHATAKLLLYHRMKASLVDGSPLLIEWECALCACAHNGDLMKGVDDAQLERVTEGIRPDLRLPCGGRVAKAIEVVNTHAPSDAVHSWAESNGVPLLVFEVHDADDVARLGLTPLKPDVQHLDRCSCSRCPEEWCNSQGVRQCITAPHEHCRVCRQPVGHPEDHDHCLTCGERQYSDHGMYHGHCQDCGIVCDNGLRSDGTLWARCYCCAIAKKHGMPTCPDKASSGRSATHGHCRDCGKRIKSEYEFCYQCHSRASVRLQGLQVDPVGRSATTTGNYEFPPPRSSSGPPKECGCGNSCRPGYEVCDSCFQARMERRPIGAAKAFQRQA